MPSESRLNQAAEPARRHRPGMSRRSTEPDLSRPAFCRRLLPRRQPAPDVGRRAKRNKTRRVLRRRSRNCSGCFWPILELGPQGNVRGHSRRPVGASQLQGRLPAARRPGRRRSAAACSSRRSASARRAFDKRNDADRSERRHRHGRHHRAVDQLPLRIARAQPDARQCGYQHPAQPPMPRQRASGVVSPGSMRKEDRRRSSAESPEAHRTGPATASQINGARSLPAFRDRVPQQVTIWAVPFESALAVARHRAPTRAGSVDHSAADAQPRPPLQQHQRPRSKRA